MHPNRMHVELRSLPADDTTTRSPNDVNATDNNEPPVPEDRFDPYDYGQTDGIGRWAATFHVIRSSIGAGFLVLPYAMKNLGYITGAALMLLVGVVYFGVVNTLLRTEYRLCERLRVKRVSFVELADQIFGRAPTPLNRLRVPVLCLMYAYYALPVGKAATLIAMSTSLQYLARCSGLKIHITHIATVLLCPLAACCMLDRFFKILAPYSAISNLFALFVAVVALVGGGGGGGGGVTVPKKPYTMTARPFGRLEWIPQGVAVFVQTVRCTGIVIPLRNEMKRPQTMLGMAGVLNVSAAALTSFYTAFGVAAYLLHGERTRSNVLSGLSSASDNLVVSFAAHLLYASEMAVAFVLGFYVRFQNVWSPKLRTRFANNEYQLVIEYTIRLGIIASTYVIAVCLPNVGLIMSIAGVASIVVEVALPLVLELLVALETPNRRRLTVAKDLCILGSCAVLLAVNAKNMGTKIIQLYQLK